MLEMNSLFFFFNLKFNLLKKDNLYTCIYFCICVAIYVKEKRINFFQIGIYIAIFYWQFQEA